MRIFCDGSRFFAGQVDRIEDGFRELGHEIVTDMSAADLVYVNDQPHYDLTIASKIAGKVSGKVIFTVLDCAPHVPDFPMAKLTAQLEYADAVCTISETVQQDLLVRSGGVLSRIIYQPIKPITRTGVKRYPRYRVLFVGRVNDLNKRCGIGAAALIAAGFKGDEIVTVGSDTPFYGGHYVSVIGDGALNDLYNSVDFVMMPSRHEGIGLPAIEAMAAGAIPVICNDLSTRTEFFAGIPEYETVEPTPTSIAQFIAGFTAESMAQFKDRLHQHYLTNWAAKMSGRGVAESILRVYDTIQ